MYCKKALIKEFHVNPKNHASVYDIGNDTISVELNIDDINYKAKLPKGMMRILDDIDCRVKDYTHPAWHNAQDIKCTILYFGEAGISVELWETSKSRVRRLLQIIKSDG